MEKLIRILHIFAYSVIVAGVVFYSIYMNNQTPRTTFLFNCIFPVFVVLAIPSFDRPLALKAFRVEISPKIRLWIYAVLACVLIPLMGVFGAFTPLLDLPSFINNNYSQTSQANMNIIGNHSSRLTGRELRIVANGTRLYIAEDSFLPLNASEKYTFFYLPRTGWVMDIIDVDGRSLLR